MVYETTVFVGLATYLLRVSLINHKQIFTKISTGNSFIGVNICQIHAISNIKIFDVFVSVHHI